MACLAWGPDARCFSKAVITIAIRLRYDYDPTTTTSRVPASIRREQKKLTIFRRSRVVVVS